MVHTLADVSQLGMARTRVPPSSEDPQSPGLWWSVSERSPADLSPTRTSLLHPLKADTQVEATGGGCPQGMDDSGSCCGRRHIWTQWCGCRSLVTTGTVMVWI